MFVRICIFYRSMSQMEQYDNMNSHDDTVCVLWNKVMVCAEGEVDPLFSI